MMNATTTDMINVKEIMSGFNPGSEMILRAMSWDGYNAILDSTVEESGLRISFDGETIKIVSLSVLHEVYVRFLEQLMAVVRLQTRTRIASTGSMTMKRRRGEKGLEADCTFYVQNARTIQGKKKINLDTDTPPDIAVEIDIHHSSKEKWGIYAALEIPEVWNYDGEFVRMYQLDNENYVEINQSSAIPILSAAVLTDFLNRSPNADQYDLLVEFEEWLQQQVQQ